MAEDSGIEVTQEQARQLAAKGAELVWVLGIPGHVAYDKMCGITERIRSMTPEEVTGESKNLIKAGSILVCEHGITSMFLAKQLRKEGLTVYSLKGGVSELQ